MFDKYLNLLKYSGAAANMADMLDEVRIAANQDLDLDGRPEVEELKEKFEKLQSLITSERLTYTGPGVYKLLKGIMEDSLSIWQAVRNSQAGKQVSRLQSNRYVRKGSF